MLAHIEIQSFLRIYSLVLFFFFYNLTTAFSQNTLQPIGFWREHLSYENALKVVLGDKLYCATCSNIFSIDTDNEIERFSTVNGLSDIGINTIAFDTKTNQLVIAYNSSDIDIIKGNIVKNISEIKNSTIVGNKNIFSIYCKDGIAYAATGIGIVLIDLEKYQIKDTWYIGSNATQLSIYAIATANNAFYAATEIGLKKALQNSNLSNHANWQTIAFNNLPVQQVVSIGNQIVVLQNNSVWIEQATGFNLLYTKPGFKINSIERSNNHLLICEQSNNSANVIEINTNGVIINTIQSANNIVQPTSAINNMAVTWIADNINGLLAFSAGKIEQYLPNGPKGISTGEMVIRDNEVLVAAGSLNAWQNTNSKNGMNTYANDEWKNINATAFPVLDSIVDIVSLAVDPSDNSIWAGSFGGGLVNIANKNIRIFKQHNSSLQNATVLGNTNNCNVSGLAFDQNKHLWISNYGAIKNLSVRKKDGSFQSFTIPFIHTENAVADILVDDANQIWILSPKGNGIFCFNYNNTIEVLTDDKWRLYQTGQNRGNLPTNNVHCFTKDKDGFIWVGTDRGIGIIDCAANVFTQNCDAILPIIQRSQFAGYLFQDENVQSIAVDGANRKWVGTKNGVWLISADGNSIIYRFSRENSPLLSNDVQKIVIHPTTGEVFFATTKGICSFRSTATEVASSSSNDVLVFPNPVPPDYNGTIAIRGIVNNAWIKIVEPNGRLVFETKALGTQAVWNGRNYKGEKVASGVYLVLVKENNGNEKMVTKLVIVR